MPRSAKTFLSGDGTIRCRGCHLHPCDCMCMGSRSFRKLAWLFALFGDVGGMTSVYSLLSLVGIVMLAILSSCSNPTDPQPRTSCIQSSDFHWEPVVDAATGDTVMWFGVCGYVQERP